MLGSSNDNNTNDIDFSFLDCRSGRKPQLFVTKKTDKIRLMALYNSVLDKNYSTAQFLESSEFSAMTIHATQFAVCFRIELS